MQDKTQEKTYLKAWQKVAYGAGDFGSNFMYTFVSSYYNKVSNAPIQRNAKQREGEGA